jgi:hypothetical protein
MSGLEALWELHASLNMNAKGVRIDSQRDKIEDRTKDKDRYREKKIALSPWIGPPFPIHLHMGRPECTTRIQIPLGQIAQPQVTQQQQHMLQQPHSQIAQIITPLEVV